MTAPRAVMACTECGPVITEAVCECPLCPGIEGHEVYWVDLAAGLERLGASNAAVRRLCYDAANRLRAQQAELEALKSDGGAKRRRQQVKAERLAEVIADWTGPKLWPSLGPVSPKGLSAMPGPLWAALTAEVNRRHPNDPQGDPSDETKALVIERFTESQEAGR